MRCRMRKQTEGPYGRLFAKGRPGGRHRVGVYGVKVDHAAGAARLLSERHRAGAPRYRSSQERPAGCRAVAWPWHAGRRRRLGADIIPTRPPSLWCVSPPSERKPQTSLRRSSFLKIRSDPRRARRGALWLTNLAHRLNPVRLTRGTRGPTINPHTQEHPGVEETSFEQGTRKRLVIWLFRPRSSVDRAAVS